MASTAFTSGAARHSRNTPCPIMPVAPKRMTFTRTSNAVPYRVLAERVAGRTRRSTVRWISPFSRGRKPCAVLTKPSPTRLEEQIRSERQLSQHRRLGCQFYSACLDQSADSGWESFSCEHCPFAKQAPEPRAEAMRYAHSRDGGRFD